MNTFINAVLGLSGPIVYVVVGAIAFGEAAAFIGLVLPGETALFIGGVIASQGQINLGTMIIVAIVAAITGDSVGYEIGRRFGPALKNSRAGRYVGQKRWDKGEAFLAKRGGSAVLIGRWVGLLRALVPALAGMGKMPYRRFLLFNAIGGSIWAAAIVLLGYFAGESYRTVEHYMGRASLVLGLIVAGIVIMVLAAHFVIRHRAWVTGKLTALAQTRGLRGPIALSRRVLTRLVTSQRPYASEVRILVAGLLAAAVLTAAAAAATDYLLDGKGTRFDLPVAAWFAAHQDDDFTVLMQVLNTLGGWAVLPLAGLIISAVVSLRNRTWRPVTIMAATVAANAVLIFIGGSLMSGAAVDDVTQASHLFPASGALISITVIGLLVFMLFNAINDWAARVVLCAVAITLVVLNGLSNLYLGEQWFSNIVVTWLIGTAWLVVVTFGFTLAWPRPKPATSLPGPVRRSSPGDRGGDSAHDDGA